MISIIILIVLGIGITIKEALDDIKKWVEDSSQEDDNPEDKDN